MNAYLTRIHSKNFLWGGFPLSSHKTTLKKQINSQKQRGKKREKDVSRFGLVFTACSVFGSLLASSLLSVVLSVILWLDKGDFPENVHTVCPCQNK